MVSDAIDGLPFLWASGRVVDCSKSREISRTETISEAHAYHVSVPCKEEQSKCHSGTHDNRDELERNTIRLSAQIVGTNMIAGALERQCDDCGKHSAEGKLGEADFVDKWFCSDCWRIWEGSTTKVVRPNQVAWTNEQQVSDSAAKIATPDRDMSMPWDLNGQDVLFWLVGKSSLFFLEKDFGRQWVHVDWPEPRVNFTVAETLRCLRNFRPGPGRLEHCQRMQRYGFTRCAVVTQDWASEPLKFWSGIMCRSVHGSYEDIDDEEVIANFLSSRQLETENDFSDRSENWTFILNQVQGASPHLQGLHHALWAFFGLSGGINSYLTPGFAVGKAPHVDEHDVFVLQQYGAKRWTLFEEDMLTVKHDVTLKPGSVLYIPQGIPHCARCVSSEPSLHLAVSVARSPYTGAGLISAFSEIRGSTQVSRDVARRIEENRKRILEYDASDRVLTQLLPWPRWRCLLRAFHSEDCPSSIRDELCDWLLPSVKALQSYFSCHAPNSNLPLLRDRLEEPSTSAEVLASFWAWREHQFEEHYMIHMPIALSYENDETTPFDSCQDGLWCRAPNAAAFLMQDGCLNVNGYRVLQIPPELQASLRFCMGVHTGARGLPFLFQDVPGLTRKTCDDALRLLIRFRGVERATDKLERLD